MGIYKRKDSRYYWLLLERKDEKSIREATRILATRENRRFAEEAYRARLTELARTDYLGVPRGRGVRPRADLSGWCNLYFVSDGTHVKIGRAVNVLKRLRALQTSHAKRLEVLAVVPCHSSLERLVQRHFSDERIDREWFAMSDRLRLLIERARSGAHPFQTLWNEESNHVTVTPGDLGRKRQ